MKTLVALSALVAVTIAAPPALNSWDTTLQQKVPQTTVRDKKSPTFPIGGHGFPTTTGMITPGFGHSGFGHSGFGHSIMPGHLVPHFRDTEGKESAESGESTCMKKMKVKLCKADKLKSEAVDSEDNIVNRLEMAKAVVEDLEQDLEKMENHPNAKMSQWKQADAMDSDLREDVEIAKQALAHIKSHFGNLESMNLQLASMKAAESIPEENFEVVHTEEERLAQWKNALENIQQNAEIMKGIEESFKAKSVGEFEIPENKKITLADEKSAADTDIHMVQWKAALENIQKNAKIMKTIQEQVKSVNSQSLDDTEAKEAAEIEEHTSNFEVASENQSRETKNENEETLNKHEDLLEEMKTSATEMRESNVETDKESVSSITESEKNSSHEDLKSFKFVSPSETKKLESFSLKKEEIEYENKPKEAENMQLLHEEEKTRMETAPSEIKETKVDVNEDHLRKTEDFNLPKEEALHHLHEKEAETESMLTESTSSVVQHVEEKEHTPKMKATNKEESLTSIKAVENVVQQVEDQSNLKHLHENKFEKEITLKTAEVDDLMFRTPHTEGSGIASGSHGPSLGGFQNQGNLRGHSGHHHSHTVGNSHFQPHHDMSGSHSLGHQDISGSHSMPHQDISNQFPSKNLFHSSHGQMHQPHGHSIPMRGQKLHENLSMNGKAVDMIHAASMNDAPIRAPLDHNMRWSQTHGAGRTAYGSPAGLSIGGQPSAFSIGGPSASALSIGGPSSASGGSASVGVFPNAHVSDCAIPLLLSCAPNVVQGQLAKSHATYSAPAYRSDEFNFHKKREAKKIDSEIKNTPIKKAQLDPKTSLKAL